MPRQRILYDGSGFRATLTDYGAGHAMAPHAHETVGLSVVLAGRVWERAERAVEMAGALSVVVKPEGHVHENHFGPDGARLLAFSFAPDYFEGLDGGRPREWCWRHGDGEAVRALRLCRWAAHAGELGPSMLDDAVGLLLSPDSDTVPTRGAPPRWLVETRTRLHDSVGCPPSVEALARMAGVHRVTLASAFSRHFGFSVTAYQRRLRLRAAAAALATTDAPLAAIAQNAGFTDQSHFTRVFRAATGTTPGAFRAGA